MDTQIINKGPTPGTGALVSTHETQITTVDMFDQNRAKGALMVASQLATSSLIPEHYQRRPDNVLVAMYRAARLGVDVFAYMETTYPVHGRLGHEAKFIVSLINTSGKFKTPLLYEMSGEIVRTKDGKLSPESTRKCKAYAVLKDCGEKISQEVDIQMAFAEGWIKNSKWNNMPDIMLQYRSASFFGKMYCPELVMGLNTRDELEDISDAEAVEATETGRDIFEKGEPVDTAAAPVLDPAMEVKPPDAPVNDHPDQEKTSDPPPPKQESPATPVEQVELQLPTGGDAAPPTEPGAFWHWFAARFAGEADKVDRFLQSKKWLPAGGTAAELSESRLKSLRAQWDKFLSAYEAFKRSGSV